MKIYRMVPPLLSLSLTLFACAPQADLQGSQIPTQEALTTSVQQSERVQFSYQTPEAFQTQAVDLAALKYIKLSLVGSGISGTLTGDFVAVTGKSATATLQNVPLQPGEMRVVTVQGYDADKKPLNSFVGKGYYVSQAGVATVQLQIDRRHLIVGRILERLLQSSPVTAKNVDITRVCWPW